MHYYAVPKSLNNNKGWFQWQTVDVYITGLGEKKSVAEPDKLVNVRDSSTWLADAEGL